MRCTLGIVAVAVGIVFAAAPAISSEKSPVSSEVADLVRACKLEAKRGHLKHASGQRLGIEEHKQRMANLCDEWDAAIASEQDEVVSKCKSEAAWGARHVHRGGNGDRTHMVRLQSLCERLAHRDQEKS